MGGPGEISLPYESRNYLVSKSERSFLGVLDQVVGTNYRIFSKVRLEDVIKTRRGLKNKERIIARNRIKSRHLDFVLCHPKNLQIIAAIELDDGSHQSQRSISRDDFINKVLKICEIPLLEKRWSPYAFDKKAVPQEDILSLFEAVRCAPSSYNEQPWRYIIATSENKEEFNKILSCLVEANREWAQHAPVLALGVASLKFERNGQPNRAAIHDLGTASAFLTVEATARGLFVHQMIGIEPSKARDIYNIPNEYEPMTGLAIGYQGDPNSLPKNLQDRDLKRRPRKLLSEIIFSHSWANGCNLINK